MRRTLAGICGISTQAVRDWEDGSTKNIKHEHLASIARHFRVSIDYLITGSRAADTGGDKYERAVRQLQGLPEGQRESFLRMLDELASAQGVDTE